MNPRMLHWRSENSLNKTGPASHGPDWSSSSHSKRRSRADSGESIPSTPPWRLTQGGGSGLSTAAGPLIRENNPRTRASCAVRRRSRALKERGPRRRARRLSATGPGGRSITASRSAADMYSAQCRFSAAPQSPYGILSSEKRPTKQPRGSAARWTKASAPSTMIFRDSLAFSYFTMDCAPCS